MPREQTAIDQIDVSVDRGQIHRDGQRYDLVWMGILREEWLKISGER